MSEMTLFKSGAALPDYLRGASDDFTRSLAGSSGGKTISIRGGVFRMIVGGEEIARNEDRTMNLVVVNAAPYNGRTYYVGSYEEGQVTSPTCWSADGKTPDPTAAKPQSTSCMTCPQNVKGSGQNDSRACRFSRRIAVVLEGDIGGNVYRLQLPSKSLFGDPKGQSMPMIPYARFLAGHQIPIYGVVTEARFDTDAPVPMLKFRALRPLTKEELTLSEAQRTSEEAAQAIEMKFSAPNASTSTPALAAPFSPPAESAPTKRATKRADAPAAPRDMSRIMSEWAGDDDA